MKVRRVTQLTKDVVGQFGSSERVTTIKPEDLKSVIGGVEIAAEAHCHYNYASCTSCCGAAEA